MDEVVQLCLQTSSGKTCSVSPLRSTTLRSILAGVNLKFPNPCCLLNGRILSLDMSIASQGIQSADTIYVVSQRRKESSQRKPATVRGFEESLREEALRCSDVAFLQYDLCKEAHINYEAWIREGDNECVHGAPTQTTIVKSAHSVSSEPLPICWNETEVESEGDTVLSSFVIDQHRPNPRVHCDCSKQV